MQKQNDTESEEPLCNLKDLICESAPSFNVSLVDI